MTRGAASPAGDPRTGLAGTRSHFLLVSSGRGVDRDYADAPSPATWPPVPRRRPVTRLGTCSNPQNLALSWDIRLFVWPRVVAVGVVVAVGSTGSPPRQVMGQPRGTPPGSGDRGAVGGGGGDGPGHLHAGCSLHPLTGRSRGLFLLLALARPSVCCPQTPLIPLRGHTAPYFCWHDTQVASRTTFLGASRGFHKPRVLHKTPMVWPDEAHQGPSTAQGLLTKAQPASLWVTHHGP